LLGRMGTSSEAASIRLQHTTHCYDGFSHQPGQKLTPNFE
jgi:hypothetical protein